MTAAQMIENTKVQPVSNLGIALLEAAKKSKSKK